jgi:2,5-diamino-6-(ribosylamino)-4(3H)-pyrimidinone 5'-phosphate reductase
MPKPRVIVHAAISMDARSDGFEPDVGAYYELSARWDEDVTLCGSGTIVSAMPDPDPADAPPVQSPSVGEDRPLLAVIDSRGRVRSWRKLLSAGHWRAGLSFCSEATRAEHIEYLEGAGIECERLGSNRVDVARALEALEARGTRTVRVDAGPTLNGHLLGRGLVDELSLLVHPVIAGEGRMFAADIGSPVDLGAGTCERHGRLLWLRFEPA